MKIAVLGATGSSGQQVIEQGLNLGYTVLALVRNPDAVTTKHENLQVHNVDIMDAGTMVGPMKGCDAVLSCLGGKLTMSTYFSKVYLYSNSAKAIVEAMRTAQVKRFVVITSWCTVYKPEHPKMIEWLLKPLFIGNLLKDMAVMEDYLEEQKDINFTIVRPPGLADWPLSDKEIIAKEGAQFVADVHFQIARANVAKFMLDSLLTDSWNRKIAAIGMMK